MISYSTYPGPNDRKVAIMLEESGCEYVRKIVDILRDEQFAPEFLAISPNNKIPAIVDDSGPESVAVFETGAILTYLAEKSGRRLSRSQPERARTMAWLCWSVTGLGATLPQVHFFGDRAEQFPDEVLDRFMMEAIRLVRILERRVSESPHLMQDYSVADIPTYASAKGMLGRIKEFSRGALADTPSIDRWIAAIDQRPALQRVMAPAA